jgi:phosphoribosyl 1,2-cyclic phosphodiesterase
MGGNTPCVEVRAGAELIIFDAGSGIRALGEKLMKEGKPVHASLFMSHFHHDHVQGFPFFTPAFVPATHLKIHAERKGELGVKDIFEEVMSAPFFPIPLAYLKSQMEFIEVKENQEIALSQSVKVITRKLQHPNGSIGYRVESTEKGKKRVFAYISDNEQPYEPDQNLIDLAQNADAICLDTAYTPQEYETRKGWGHSPWTLGVKLAKAAKVKRLILFHHDPIHNDRDLMKILEEVRKEFKSTQLSYEGLELSF